MANKAAPSRSLGERLQDLDLIQQALGRAVRSALLQHKQAGNPIAAWRDGRVVRIEPQDIVIEPEP
jgi:hypothetical protein